MLLKVATLLVLAGSASSPELILRQAEDEASAHWALFKGNHWICTLPCTARVATLFGLKLHYHRVEHDDPVRIDLEGLRDQDWI